MHSFRLRATHFLGLPYPRLRIGNNTTWLDQTRGRVTCLVQPHLCAVRLAVAQYTNAGLTGVIRTSCRQMADAGASMSVFAHDLSGRVHKRTRTAPLLSVCAHGTRTRVQSRTRGGRFGRLRVRLCTRRLLSCAKSDTRLAVSRRSCPLVHTLSSVVCKVGHAGADSGDYESVCAHAAFRRVQSRTQDWPYRAVLVRSCTPLSAPCAQADTTTGEGLRTSACARGQLKTAFDGIGVVAHLRVREGQRPLGRAVDRDSFFKLIRAARAAVSLQG